MATVSVVPVVLPGGLAFVTVSKKRNLKATSVHRTTAMFKDASDITLRSY